ncbi:6-phosphogluconolactonase, partial [Frankia sp. AgB32]|uniref:6-phosphogluconolactonase n=1 Tax=Frankia sp. AgB32 TaxID=631119 RepID=UPI00200FA8C3
MSAEPRIVAHRDAGVLARAVAARLITSLVDGQAARGEASVVLTGGGIGIALLRAVRTSPAADAVDWSTVDVWWGGARVGAPPAPAPPPPPAPAGRGGPPPPPPPPG